MALDVLVIDDDRDLIDLLKKYLANFEINTLSATHPDLGLEILAKFRPALVILDVMLPGRDGFKVCREIRMQTDTPIIMLTARGEITDKIVGFETGADDYLAKPFNPRELVARIQAVLKRGGTRHFQAAMLRCGKLSMDERSRRVQIGNSAVDLTTMEFDILALFMRNPGAVISREKIMESVRGAEHEAFNRSVDLAVSRLRHKLGDSPEHTKYIKTIWAAGYMFLGKVEQIAP